MSLSLLPVEIIQAISTHLSSKDVLTCIRVSRQLYTCLIRTLYGRAKHQKRYSITNTLTTGLHEVTFWFDKRGSGSIVEWAIIHDHAYTFKQLILEPTVDLLQADSYRVTLLHRLSGQGFTQYMEPLIRRLQDIRIDPFQVDLSLLTPLHYAASRGMTKAVHLLVQLGADVSAKDYHGNTPLHLAAAVGSHQVFAQLIQAGANINSKARFGWTPVDQASISHHHNAVDELMRLGSRPPTWQQRKDALNEFVRLSPCPLECYDYHVNF